MSVPGCVDGWEALGRYGLLGLADVLAPAIAIAIDDAGDGVDALGSPFSHLTIIVTGIVGASMARAAPRLADSTARASSSFASAAARA